MKIQKLSISTNINNTNEPIIPDTITNKPKANLDDFKQKKKEQAQAYKVNLSEEGIERNKNNFKKKKGSHSLHEDWEESSAIYKKDRRDEFGNIDLIETMRLDEPETYTKIEELVEELYETYAQKIYDEEGNVIGHHVICESPTKWSDLSQEQKDLTLQISALERDWFERRCMKTGWFRNPVEESYAAMEAIEDTYSAWTHQLSINYYNDDNSNNAGHNYRESMWKYNTKYALLLTTNMMKTIPQYNEKEMHELIKRIDKAVQDMEQIDIDYEGNLEYMQYGVKLHDDGTQTYHANVGYNKKTYEVQADTPEELLKKLTNLDF